MKKIGLLVGCISSLVAMGPSTNLLKVPVSKLPFNPFIPRASWIVKKSVFSESLTPAMVRAFSRVGITFAPRSTMSQLYASITKALGTESHVSEQNIASVPNFSVMVRAVPSAEEFQVSSAVSQELTRHKPLKGVSRVIKGVSRVPIAPVVRLSCVDQGNELLFTFDRPQENVVEGLTRVQTEMGVTQASWLRVTRNMELFSLIDALYRRSTGTLFYSDQAYDVAGIIAKGSTCEEKRDVQTQTEFSKDVAIQPVDPETDSWFKVTIVDDAQTQTEPARTVGTQTPRTNLKVIIVDDDQTQTEPAQTTGTQTEHSKAVPKLRDVKTRIKSELTSRTVERSLSKTPASKIPTKRVQRSKREQSVCNSLTFFEILFFFIFMSLIESVK